MLTELVYRQLGTRIEQVRSTLGWSQQDLAIKTGDSRGSIANIETGRQRLLMHDVESIAKAFGMSPKVLLRGIWT